MKRCTLCKVEKSLPEFSKHRFSKDGYSHWCKECNNKRAKAWRSTPSGIYSNIRGRENHRKRKPFNITKEDFIEWYLKQPQLCSYCGISQGDAHLMRTHFGAHGIQLSIDCKDNRLGYIIENLVLACDRCNFIKSNIFSYDEMREIGEKYIRPKWEAFPEITKGREE